MKFWARKGERFAMEDVHWYGANGPVDFASRTLAYCLHGANDLYVMINALWVPCHFTFKIMNSPRIR